MTVLRSIQVNEYRFRSALYPKPAGSRLLQPLLLGPPYRLKCIGNCTYYGLNSAFKVIFLHFKTFVCSKCKEMLILLHWSSERTNPVTSHAVVLQDGGALASKAITKQTFFFKMVTLIMFVIYFFIKMELIFLNNVNLTDCFISTLKL